MADRSCPRCGEVVQYVGEPDGGRVCPICGEPSPGNNPPVGWSSTAVSATPSPPGFVVGAEDEPSLPSPAPEYALASAGQVGLATFLGGPAAGWLLMARNYFKLGRGGAGWATLLGGVLITAIVVGVSFALPDSLGRANLLPGVVILAITYACANALQGAAVQEHLARGGQNVGGLVILGYIVLGIVTLLGPLIGGVVLYEIVLGDETLAVTPKEDILYGRNVSVEEARTLGLVLQGQGFFNNASEKTVGLHKDGDTYDVMFVLRFGFEDADTQNSFRTLALKISEAFDGKPIRVDLCDQEMTSKKKLLPVQAGK